MTLKTLHLMVPLIAALFSAGCHQPAAHHEEAELDSTLQQLKHLVTAEPELAYSKLDSIQRLLADSSCWWRAELFKATSLEWAGRAEQAEHTYRQVEDWCRLHPEQYRLQSELWHHRGTNLQAHGDYDRAITCYRKAQHCYDLFPKTDAAIRTALNLADTYMLNGKPVEAADQYHQSLFLCDSLHNTTLRLATHTGLAQVYMELGNYTLSHYYFNLVKRNLDNYPPDDQAYYYSFLGNCYYYQERYQPAIQAFRQAAALNRQTGQQMNELISYCNLAEVYLMQDSLEQAEQMLARYDSILPYVRNQLSEQLLFNAMSLKADLYIARGETAKAMPVLRMNADSILQSMPRALMLHYRRLARYAKQHKRWKMATEMQEKSSHYANALSSEQNRSMVQELSQRFTRDTTMLRQQLVLAGYKARTAKQQNLIILSISLGIIVALTVVIMLLVYHRRTQRRQKRQMEQMANLRMNIVRNRMSPHYMFNVMGTMLPKMQRHPELKEEVDLFIDLLRGTLVSSDSMATSLSHELKMVERYVELHHHSHDNRPLVTWEIDPRLQPDTVQVLSMSLQIPVENALKHAFDPPSPDDVIHIAALHKGDHVEISVTDNGMGYEPGRIRRTGRDTGSGLLMLSRTVHILNQYNREQASFHITNLPAPQHGTRMVLCLPVNYSFTLPRRGN
ncbi:MAG: tetratricopeptide repeat protein [Alloprevotella sp.]